MEESLPHVQVIDQELSTAPNLIDHPAFNSKSGTSKKRRSNDGNPISESQKKVKVTENLKHDLIVPKRNNQA